jgi:hypothetical protein
LGVAGLDASAKVPLAQIPNISVANGNISDIQVSAPAVTQVLTYDGTKWTNSTVPSGGANLAYTPITVGVGDGTSAPQTVTLRGPVGAGADVTPGDLIIQAPAGTGGSGSGKIRFQTAAKPLFKPTPLYTAGISPSSSVAISSLSTTVFVPSGISNCMMLAILTTSASATVNTFTFGGTAITILGTSSNATIGTYSIGYVQNVSAGTTKTLSATVSASSMLDLNFILLENVYAVGGFVSQTITNATSASLTVNNVLSNDLVLDFSFYRNAVSSILNETPTPQVPILSLNNVFGGSPYKTWSISGTYVPDDGQTTVTMNQTYASSITAFYCAFYIQRARPVASSTAATFTDVLVLDNNGVFSLPANESLFTIETTDMTSTYVKVLTTTSPRIQKFTSTGTLTTPEVRLIILPDAETLSVGDQFFISSSMTDRTLQVLPRMSSPAIYPASSFSQGANNLRLLTGNTYHYKRSFATGAVILQSSNKYGGIWNGIINSLI